MTGKYDEDLEQEIYIRTWQNLKNYEEQNKFKSWLNTIAYNFCKDYLKSSAFQKSIKQEELNENIITKDKTEQELDSKQRQKRILKEINRLPSKLKEVVIFYEFEEKTYEDISMILNISTGTVKSRLHNARELLKIALKDLLQN